MSAKANPKGERLAEASARGRLALIHNGIIENYATIKENLQLHRLGENDKVVAFINRADS